MNAPHHRVPTNNDSGSKRYRNCSLCLWVHRGLALSVIQCMYAERAFPTDTRRHRRQLIDNEAASVKDVGHVCA